MDEAIDTLEASVQSRPVACARVSVPIERHDFIAEHDFMFLVEQNRHAQLRKLIVNECAIDPARLIRSFIMTARRSPRDSSLAPSPSTRWLKIPPLRKAAE